MAAEMVTVRQIDGDPSRLGCYGWQVARRLLEVVGAQLVLCCIGRGSGRGSGKNYC